MILGQDPYPTPGDAHGLAFSYRRPRRLPASLKAILAEWRRRISAPRPDDAATSRPGPGRASLLLNTALTVEAGASRRASAARLVGARRRGGRGGLGQTAGGGFLLWGGPARRRAALVDRAKHLVSKPAIPPRSTASRLPRLPAVFEGERVAAGERR